jgi:sugar (pentulose or hexulose) kinase
MMHGYLAFDELGNLLTPFRTWRNTNTTKASQQLSTLFQFTIPQRWSIAHLYQAIIDNEAHIGKIAFITTLAGYVHWQLTTEKVVGLSDAAGIFPLDEKGNYHPQFMAKFDALIAQNNSPFVKKLADILPKIVPAGQMAGALTTQGQVKLGLTTDIPLCPPEGDAGTGMVATNSVAPCTGNISAGTSIFAMLVLDKPLKNFYPEVDVVATPNGRLVAMIHCNNGTSDIDSYLKIFDEAISLFAPHYNKANLYSTLYTMALQGSNSNSGLLAYNTLAGEPVIGLDEGRPMLIRQGNSQFNLSNLMRTLIFSTLASLKLGMDILFKQENLKIDHLVGHGGFFKSEAAQKLMASALKLPLEVNSESGEGGAWGMAILAAYSHQGNRQNLANFLANKVFVQQDSVTIQADSAMSADFDYFVNNYVKGLAIQQAAIKNYTRS